MNKLYISLLLIFMPAFIACSNREATIKGLELNLASTQAVDAFIQEEIRAYKRENPFDAKLQTGVGAELWEQRVASLENVGKARRALAAAQARCA